MDVSQVIAAIDWVVQHRNDNGLNIRVINLSYGTNSRQAYTVDPLAYAAEQAWQAGIVVVAAGGNNGFQSHMNNAPALADPAIDPYVHGGRLVGLRWGRRRSRRHGAGVLALAEARRHARASTWSHPGAHLRVCASRTAYIDLNHPEGQIGSRYFRGSGTSESAAIVVGRRGAAPPEVPGRDARPGQAAAHKHRLRSTASRRRSAAASCNSGRPSRRALPSSTQTWPSSTGTGSLEAARGADHLTLRRRRR